eukprot:scaffold1168_cov167-Amphora_coffeaeformis.AAC.14
MRRQSNNKRKSDVCMPRGKKQMRFITNQRRKTPKTHWKDTAKKLVGLVQTSLTTFKPVWPLSPG